MNTATQRSHLSTAISLTSSILLGLVFSQLIGKPLAQLTVTARELGSGNLSARSNVNLKDEIGVLAGAINHMASQLQSTMVSKAEVDNVLQSMREMLLVTNRFGVITQINRAVTEMLDYTEEELLGQKVTTVFAEAPHQEPDLPEYNDEQVFVTKSTRRLPVHCSGAALKTSEGAISGYVLVALDISEHKRAQAALHNSLAEKEVLLRELHHRVKNNLQIISSLLQLQGRQISDPRAAQRFSECEGRVRAMSLIHEQLYQSQDLS